MGGAPRPPGPRERGARRGGLARVYGGDRGPRDGARAFQGGARRAPACRAHPHFRVACASFVSAAKAAAFAAVLAAKLTIGGLHGPF